MHTSANRLPNSISGNAIERERQNKILVHFVVQLFSCLVAGLHSTFKGKRERENRCIVTRLLWREQPPLASQYTTNSDPCKIHLLPSPQFLQDGKQKRKSSYVPSSLSMDSRTGAALPHLGGSRSTIQFSRCTNASIKV